MALRPQTLYGLADSPVALAAWMLDHDARSYEDITQRLRRRPVGNLTRDEVLDNVTLTWMTNTGISSGRLYWENSLGFFDVKGVVRPGGGQCLPARALPGAAELDRAGLPEPHVLQRGRRGQPLRGLAGARPLHGRATGRVPVAALEGTHMTSPWMTPAGLHLPAVEVPVEGQLPSFSGARGGSTRSHWRRPDLRGKVVLVDFWTYTCINWLRTLPYVRAWAERYREQGLVVIGVHTPEFCVRARRRQHRTCRAARGRSTTRSRSTTTTRSGRRSTTTTGRRCTSSTPRAGSGTTISERASTSSRRWSSSSCSEAVRHDRRARPRRGRRRGRGGTADWDTLSSAENYIGYERSEGFASPGGVVSSTPHGYTAQRSSPLNRWALGGDWTIGRRRPP